MSFHLEIETGGAAFADDEHGGVLELSRILNRLAAELDNGAHYQDGGTVRDMNGNTCGRWSLDVDADTELEPDDIPEDFVVRPIERGTGERPTTCGTCGLTWDDAIVTGWTPAPSARCPFEYFHIDEEVAR